MNACPWDNRHYQVVEAETTDARNTLEKREFKGGRWK